MKLIDVDDLKRSIRRQAGFIRWLEIDGLTQIADEMEKGFIQEIDKAPVVLEFDGEINRVVVRDEEYFKKPQWIPCEERLPNRDELVLVTYKTTSKIHLCKYLDDGSENSWWSYIDDCCAWNNVILAWMSLPPAYKGDE